MNVYHREKAPSTAKRGAHNRFSLRDRKTRTALFLQQMPQAGKSQNGADLRHRVCNSLESLKLLGVFAVPLRHRGLAQGRIAAKRLQQPAQGPAVFRLHGEVAQDDFLARLHQFTVVVIVRYRAGQVPGDAQFGPGGLLIQGPDQGLLFGQQKLPAARKEAGRVAVKAARSPRAGAPQATEARHGQHLEGQAQDLPGNLVLVAAANNFGHRAVFHLWRFGAGFSAVARVGVPAAGSARGFDTMVRTRCRKLPLEMEFRVTPSGTRSAVYVPRLRSLCSDGRTVADPGRRRLGDSDPSAGAFVDFGRAGRRRNRFSHHSPTPHRRTWRAIAVCRIGIGPTSHPLPASPGGDHVPRTPAGRTCDSPNPPAPIPPRRARTPGVSEGGRDEYGTGARGGDVGGGDFCGGC